MEGLILMLGGLLGGVFALVVSLAGAVVGLVVDVITTLILTFTQRSRPTESGEPQSAPVGRRTAPVGKWLRWGAWICGGFLVFSFATIGILQLFFFKPAASALLQRTGAKAGMQIEFTDVRGNLFTGTFAIDGLKLESASSNETPWSAEVGTTAIDIDMLRVLGKRTWLDSLVVEDVTVEVNANPAPSFDPIASLKGLKPPPPKKRYREKRRFGIRETRLDNLELTWNRPDSRQSLVIDHFDCENLKSEYAVFQVLFRSNVVGQLNETPWKIVTEKTGPLARRTEWKFEDVPLSLAADMVGGPFKLFENGTLDVFVTDEWSLDDGPDIDFDWRFLFHGFEAKAPAGLSDSKAVQAIVAFMNQAADPLDVQFSLTWNKEDLSGSASLDMRGLADAITRALIPKDADAVKEKAKDLWKKFRESKKPE